MENEIKIPLGNGLFLVAETSYEPYEKEICVGIRDGANNYVQDLAIIRPAYAYTDDPADGEIAWEQDLFDVLVYSDKDSEDYTHVFEIELYEEVDL